MTAGLSRTYFYPNYFVLFLRTSVINLKLGILRYSRTIVSVRSPLRYKPKHYATKVMIIKKID